MRSSLLVSFSHITTVLLYAIVIPSARISNAFHISPQPATTRLLSATNAALTTTPTTLFLSAVPRDPVVPQDDFVLSSSPPSLLQRRQPPPALRRMELPARYGTSSNTVVTLAERMAGRVAMVAALWLVLQEVQTGESMPDQLMDAANFLVASL